MRRSVKTLSVIPLSLALLAGCKTAPLSVTDSYCNEYQPIMVSRADILTDGTAKQIETQNWWWDQKCNGGKLTGAMRGQ